MTGTGDGPPRRPADDPVPAPGLIRPFLVTSGRTQAAPAIGVETQVVSTRRGTDTVDDLTFEYRDIVTLCARPIAVAEIAARLKLHLGVTRVLVTDLLHRGLVHTHTPTTDPADDVDVILRVIHALRQR